ncbi:WD40 repeat-like protein [Jaminaea rosea]|uniref:Pre-mRNA-splicing factor PRP46 n=1 Tax=Jaminaea rosea TaxID=1569628 RepID=A0A316UNP2_9BASI|nr:WD40 repeat-like protein [Jaminaea rosea]PWN24785.1 WD40 repeat-like protein [Jaminaea rosea]
MAATTRRQAANGPSTSTATFEAPAPSSLSSLLSTSSNPVHSLFSSSSQPFAVASSSSSASSSSMNAAFEPSSKAHLASKISSEWADATSLHPAVQSQQERAKGAGPKPPPPGGESVGGEWIADVQARRANGSVASSSSDPTASGALIRRPEAASRPVGSHDPSSSLSTALQLKRRQMDATAQPETYHPRWKLSRVIAGHLGWVRCIAVDPNNQWFATGAGDRLIKIWDLASGELKLTLTGHISTVRGVAISDRHPYLFSCGEDKMVKCWDLEQNKVIRQYHGHLSGIYSMDLHPTLDVLVTAGRDASARVWDMRTKAQIHVLSGHTGTIASVRCQSSDPQVVTGSMDSTVRLWDLAAGKTATTLTHHKKSVRAIGVHPTKYSFASGAAGGGNNVKTWVCPEGTLWGNMAHEGIVNTLSVNADGVMFSGADNGSMRFFDYASGIPFQSVEDKPQPGSLDAEAGIMASTFDRTGTRLLTGCCDKSIKVWKEAE